MLASSSEPLKNSEPGRAPIGTASVLAIEPRVADLVNARPSTTTLIAEDVFTHWTVCHCPSLIAGPATSSAYPLEPLKPHEAWPVGWYSILYSPPAVV